MNLAFLTPEIWEYPLLASYVLVTFVLLAHARHDFTRRRILLFLALLVAPWLIAWLTANNLLVATFSVPNPRFFM